MASKTHLIVDLQLLQTSDRRRGMGLYLASLLENISTDQFTISCIVNNRLPDLIFEDIEIINNLKANIIEVDLLSRSDNEEFAASASINRKRLDSALATHIAKDEAHNVKTVYFLPALFSSEIHPVFPSSGTANLLLFYDIIPFLYHRSYFPDHEGLARKDYAQRFSEFYKADRYVTISQTTADDMIMYFGVDQSRITPIMGAAADRSKLKPKSPAFSKELDEGFVLMPSGDDFRKNNVLAVQAFASLGTKMKLVLTSNFSTGTKRTLKELYPDIIFTGSVSDEEFLWLLDNTRLVLFPSDYEGLGMPLLEAVERTRVVACSNIPVFVEISQNAFFYFNQQSVKNIAEVISKALAVDPKLYLERVKSEYKLIREEFSWSSTADKFINAVNQIQPSSISKRLAVLCPSPSSYSAVGKYALEVHAELSQYFYIDYYFEDGLTVLEPTRPNILEYAANYYPASSFTPQKAKEYDHILYHLGNSEFHADTILNALRIPANAIVHDTQLNGIFDWLERQGFITPSRRQLESKLDKIFGAGETSCLVSLATNQKILFCHSAFAKNAIGKFITPTKTQTIQVNHPIGVPTIQLKKTGSTIVSFAGIISESKGINIVKEAAANKQLQVHVFGFGVLGDSPLLQNVGKNVNIMKDLTDKEFQDALRQTNILINYRSNYHGETSRSTLEAMRYGAVVIVKDIGWYAELPDNTVVKVKSENEISGVIEDLIKDPEKMHKIGEKAREFLQKAHSFKLYADNLSKGFM